MGRGGNNSTSAKIYHAYEFDGDLKELLDFLKKMRDEFLRKIAAADEDFPIARNSLLFVADQIEENFKETSAMIYPYHGKLIVQFFGRFPNDLNKWFDDLLLRDCHYQTQTDPPDDISEKEWGQRKIMWHEILSHSGSIPSMNGFIFEFWNATCETLVIGMLKKKVI